MIFRPHTLETQRKRWSTHEHEELLSRREEILFRISLLGILFLVIFTIIGNLLGAKTLVGKILTWSGVSALLTGFVLWMFH